MLWCALWEVVDGIRDKRELVEQLLYWSRDGEYAMRRWLPSDASGGSVAIVGLRHHGYVC
jgi:hypothetical protein